jgi:hypothetical protein
MNDSQQRPGKWQRLAAAFLVAIGIASVWGLLLGWVIGIVESRLSNRDGVYEVVSVRVDGTPLIETRSLRHWEDVSYRTLDGQPVPAPNPGEFQTLSGAGLGVPPLPPGLFDVPMGWGQAESVSDSARPPVSWYLVRDNKPEGHAYFVGYDEYTAVLVGYIGREGYRKTLPPADQWFDCGRRQFGRGDEFAANTDGMSYNGPPRYTGGMSEEVRVPPWMVFVIDGGILREIDLRSHTVRTLFEATELFAVGIVRFAESAAKIDTTRFHYADLVPRVVVRTADRVVFLDPPTGAKQEFLLPDSLRDGIISVYLLKEDQLLVQWSKLGDTEDHAGHLMWLRPDGTSMRQESVTLARGQQEHNGLQACFAAVAAPIPIGWIAALGAVAPLAMVQERQAVTYGAALRKIPAPIWIALVAVIVSGAILAWWSLRLQHTYRRRESGIWCIFVFLFGAPALLAYWLEHRRARLETCGECGHLVPRDRDACADCNTPFAAPPRIGTEIFA